MLRIVQIAQIQSEKAAAVAQSEQLRSALEAKTGDVARMTGQLADAQANAHSMSQRVRTVTSAPAVCRKIVITTFAFLSGLLPQQAQRAAKSVSETT